MEKQNNNRGIIILLVIIIAILTVLCVLFATQTISLNSNTTNYDSFSTSSGSGVVEVIGYPEVKEVESGYVYDFDDDVEKCNYVYFHIKETKSEEFKKFIKSLSGNSFVLDDAIGLGCIIDGKIKYDNSSDEFGYKEYELSIKNSNKILNATESNPIKLKLEMLPNSTGSEVDMCYSHITTIEVED